MACCAVIFKGGISNTLNCLQSWVSRRSSSISRVILRWEILHHSFNWFATLEAMFLKLIEVPAIRLKRTPFKDRRGSLQTSISHWTWLASAGLPWQQNKRKFSRCSYSQLLDSNTFLISSIISCGSIELVVFMLHVKRRERGFSPSDVSFIDLYRKQQ